MVDPLWLSFSDEFDQVCDQQQLANIRYGPCHLTSKLCDDVGRRIWTRLLIVNSCSLTLLLYALLIICLAAFSVIVGMCLLISSYYTSVYAMPELRCEWLEVCLPSSPSARPVVLWASIPASAGGVSSY